MKAHLVYQSDPRHFIKALMMARLVYWSARSVPWVGEEALALTEDKTRPAVTYARGHRNPPPRPRSWTTGFWGAIVGPKNLETLTHFTLSPRPMSRRKKCLSTNEEGPNCQETLPRTILSSTNRDHGRKMQHATKGSLPECLKGKHKCNESVMGVWLRSNSRRNCHLRIKCPQLTS